MRMLELFCGRWGWSKALAARGWYCVGYDLVAPPETPQGCTFVERDILLVSVSDLRGFDFICASPPCEQFSVHGMKHFHPNPPYPESGIKLFEHTRRICEESGVPYVMENVRAAQQFVGNAVHHCGPFYLWGTGVPPLTHRGITKGTHDIPGVAINRSRYRRSGTHDSRIGISRKDTTAELATVPPELANCVADYAERLIEQNANRRINKG